MSAAVWKFELTYGANKIKMPQHARVLSCAFQGDKLMIWAVVVESNVHVERAFYVTGTGHSCEYELRGPFVGTAFTGPLVFHVFDHGEVRADKYRAAVEKINRATDREIDADGGAQ